VTTKLQTAPEIIAYLDKHPDIAWDVQAHNFKITRPHKRKLATIYDTRHGLPVASAAMREGRWGVQTAHAIGTQSWHETREEAEDVAEAYLIGKGYKIAPEGKV